jgi:hypothetical protein
VGTTKEFSKTAFVEDIKASKVSVKAFFEEGELEALRDEAISLADRLGDYLPVKWHFIVRRLIIIERSRAVASTIKHIEDRVAETA